MPSRRMAARSTTPAVSIRQSSLAAGVAVAALAAVVYANALANGMVWDDPIVLNRQLLAFRSLHDIVFTPRNIPQYSPDYYRPLTTVSYLLDRAIGGGQPFMFHLSVVLYHMLATWLVFRLGLALFAPAGLAAAGLGAALFAVHPIHTESVAWGAGRSDVLACIFALAATLAALRSDWSPWRRATGAAALVFVSVLAKETTAALFVLLPLIDTTLQRVPSPTPPVARRADRRRQRTTPVATGPAPLLLALPFAVGLVVYVGLRQAALGTIVGSASPLGADGVPKIIGAIGLYLAKLVLPIGQCAYISDLPTQPLALVVTLAMLLAGAAGLWLAWQRGQRVVVFLLLWIGMTLAPSLAIVAKIPTAPVSERYLYLPSVGFCLLVGFAAADLLRRTATRAPYRWAVTSAVALLVVAGAVATVRRNAVWRSNLALWSDTAAKNTTDGLPLRSLAAAQLEASDSATAAELFRQALQRRNDQIGKFVIYNNLGTIAMNQQRLDEAEQQYQTALSLNPNAADCLFNLGLIALTRATTTPDADGKRPHAERARGFFARAEQISPLDADIHVAFGQTLTILGDAAGARAQYQRALDLGLPASTAEAVRARMHETSPLAPLRHGEGN